MDKRIPKKKHINTNFYISHLYGLSDPYPKHEILSLEKKSQIIRIKKIQYQLECKNDSPESPREDKLQK